MISGSVRWEERPVNISGDMLRSATVNRTDARYKVSEPGV